MTAVDNTPELYVTPEMDDTSSKDIREPSVSCATVYLNIFNSTTYLFLGAAACCGFATALSFGHNAFSTHIFLCITGYIIMMSLAVLAQSPYTGWTKGIKYSHKKLVVTTMQLIGAVLAITGSAIIIGDNIFGRMVTRAHGICGICALACLCLNLLCGIVNMFASKIPSIQGIIQTGQSLLNNCTLFLAFLSLCLGYDVASGGETNDFGIFAIFMTVFAMTGVATTAVIIASEKK